MASDDEARRSPLAGLSPLGPRPAPSAAQPAPPVRDDAADAPDAGPRWGEIAGAALGLAAALPGMAAAAPSATVKIVDRSAGTTEGFRGTILEALARDEVDLDGAARILDTAGEVQLAITIRIDGLPADEAAQIAAAVHGAVAAAASGAEVDALDDAPDEARSGWALVYRLAGDAATVAKTAGDVLAEVGKAGLGVVAGVSLVRTLRRLFARTAPAGAEPAEAALTITVAIAPAKAAAAKGPSAADALKQLKEAADGLTALGKLLERGA